MQDDVTMAIKTLKDALEEISMDAGKAQKRLDLGKGTAADDKIMEWVEDMEYLFNPLFPLLRIIEREAGNFDEWMEAK